MTRDPAAPRPRAAWRRDALAVDGIELAVFEAGRTDAAAPVVVCVHGMGHWTQAAWDFVAAELAPTHRIVGFDLPGFGDSAKPHVAYTLPFFARAVGAVVAARSSAPVALLGHSLGGLAAALYAASAPERVGLLGLVAPAGFLRTPALVLKIAGSRPMRAIARRLRPAPSFVRRTFRNAVFDPATVPADYLERAVALSRDPAMLFAFADVYANAMGEFVRLRDLHARLGAYAGPTLLIWGRDDRFVPVKGLEAARAVYPQARAIVLERCGHCPTIEAPDAVVAALRAAGA